MRWQRTALTHLLEVCQSGCPCGVGGLNLSDARVVEGIVVGGDEARVGDKHIGLVVPALCLSGVLCLAERCVKPLLGRVLVGWTVVKGEQLELVVGAVR